MLIALVDSALPSSHDDASFFSAPFSLPASPPSTPIMTIQKTSTAHFIFRPHGSAASLRAGLMSSPASLCTYPLVTSRGHRTVYGTSMSTHNPSQKPDHCPE